MEGSRFDRLARALGATRSRRVASALLGGIFVTPLLAREELDARKKKKKKKCAKKCKTGCCTGKRGKCIKPEKQSLTRCGSGGEICRSTGCAGTCPNCGCSETRPCSAGQCCDGQGTCGPCRVFISSVGSGCVLPGAGNSGRTPRNLHGVALRHHRLPQHPLHASDRALRAREWHHGSRELERAHERDAGPQHRSLRDGWTSRSHASLDQHAAERHSRRPQPGRTLRELDHQQRRAHARW
jgi:hypothetical protein